MSDDGLGRQINDAMQQVAIQLTPITGHVPNCQIHIFGLQRFFNFLVLLYPLHCLPITKAHNIASADIPYFVQNLSCQLFTGATTSQQTQESNRHNLHLQSLGVYCSR